LLHDRSIKPIRAFLPSDLGTPPERPSRSRLYLREKLDERRGNTDHVRELEAEIAKREANGTLIEAGNEHDVLLKLTADRGTSAHVENRDEPLDIVRQPSYHLGVDDVREENDVKDDESGAAAPEVAAEPKAETAKAVVAEARKVTKKARKPKAKNKAKKAATKKVKKPVSKKKASAKAKKIAKKAWAKKSKVREQTCVNIFTPVKIKLDAHCKKIGKSRNRIINELCAKLVGVKIPARRAAS